jgi:glycosyltransferase involved in cell wall biosynthesis
MNFISTIIPTLNRPIDLVSAVTSILEQKQQPDELIVVDQSKDERSYNEVKKLFRAFDITPRLIYLHEPEISGLIEAKQRGVEVAKGDIISFLEDDVILHPKYFENVYSIFSDNQKILGCCGVVSNIKRRNTYDFFFRLFHCGIFYDARLNAWKQCDCNGYGVLISSRFLSGGISCYRKKVFESIKFDTSNDFFMLEDIDFSTRAADFFGTEFFFISTNLCLEHNMSPINRLKLHARWKRKVREYMLFYKKNHFKSFSFINLLWLLIGLTFESIVMSIVSRSFGPFSGSISGFFAGVFKKIIT